MASDDGYDEDVPLELLWKDLRRSPLWRTVETKLIEKRDRMVAKMIVEETLQPKTIRGQDGSVAIAAEHPMVIFGRDQFKKGYILALNEIVNEPAKAEKAAAKAKEST